MAPKTAATAEVKPKVEKAPKEEKPKAPKTIGGHPMNAVITFGADKDGKSYGPAHNPKRKDSKAHERFANYKNGATIEKTLANGVSAGDITFDSDPKRKFIVITDPGA